MSIITKALSLNPAASMTFRLVMNDFNSKYTYAQTALGHDERHRVSINPKVQFDVQRISYAGTPGAAKIYLAGLTSAAVDLTSDTEVHIIMH